MTITTQNPATGEILKEYEVMAEIDVMTIADAVGEAQLSWRDVPLAGKQKLLRKLAEALRAKKTEYAKLMSEEMGKPIKDAEGEIEKCAWACEVYADNAKDWMKDDVREVDGVEHRIILQPLGVILAIMPWNFPFWQALRFAIPTLLVGNTAILKHASNVTGSALAIEQAFKDAGFPKDTFRTIIADHDTVSKLIGNPIIKGVSLTGSTQAGKKVMETAGRHLKKVVLELGGSDPFIVCEDADLDIAVKGAVTGRLINNGQSCISSKRFIVHESLAEEFGKRMAEEVKKKIVGDPSDENTQLGSLVNEKALEIIERQVKDAVDKGAKILTGGKRVGENGFFYEPTVITGTTEDMATVTEETFGPVAPIIPFKTDEEAIRIANSTEFGLGGSVWTKDLDRGRSIALKVDSGAVFVNSITKSDPRMPFGGVKESGLGRELSDYALREFANLKSFNVYEHK